MRKVVNERFEIYFIIQITHFSIRAFSLGSERLGSLVEILNELLHSNEFGYAPGL